MKVYPEEEVRAAWNHLLETRAKIARGEAGWADIAAHFTEDAVYIDPVWGRYEGRAAIAKFMHECMVGFDDWRFPTLWSVVKDNLIICAFWSRVPGSRPNGGHYDCFSINVSIYAGNGEFRTRFNGQPDQAHHEAGRRTDDRDQEFGTRRG